MRNYFLIALAGCLFSACAAAQAHIQKYNNADRTISVLAGRFVGERECTEKAEEWCRGPVTLLGRETQSVGRDEDGYNMDREVFSYRCQ
jgi:hypothetical protein